MINSEKGKKPYQAENVLLSADKAREMARQIPQWTLEDREIKREFVFHNFQKAMDFVNQVAALAKDQKHHPDISISYNKVHLTLSTHKAGGLTEKDFSLASRIDEL